MAVGWPQGPRGAGGSLRIAGLVLAGGRAERMGRDKAAMRVAGRPLIERVATTLEAVCAPVWVASGDGRRLEACRWRQLADAEPGAGPLAGILAGLEAARAACDETAGGGRARAGGDAARPELVAVAAVDMPFASSAVLAFLASCWEGEPAVVPRVDGRLEPLHAVYATAAASQLRTLFDNGERAPTRALQRLGARVVEPREWRQVTPSGRFALNLNSPEDLLLVTADAPVPVVGADT